MSIDQIQKADDIYDSVIYTAQIAGERIGEARGIAEGERARANAIARNLLQMGMSIDQVSTATKLTIDEVRKLMQ